MNFLVFVVGLVFLYRLGLAGQMGGAASLGVCLALVLSPPLFAHAFYNSKDLPFLACFIAGIYTLLQMITRPRAGSVLAHALVSAWLVAIRITGVLVPVLTVAFAAYCVVRREVEPSPAGRLRRALPGGDNGPDVGALADAVARSAGEFRERVHHDEPLSVEQRRALSRATHPGDRHSMALRARVDRDYDAASVSRRIRSRSCRHRETHHSAERAIPSAPRICFALLLLAWLVLPLASVIGLHSVMSTAGDTCSSSIRPCC